MSHHVLTSSSGSHQSKPCTKHVPIVYQSYASTNMPTMCIYQYANHVHLPICQQQNESSCMYTKSTIKHVPINLLVGASTNVLEVYQSCINYGSSLNPPFTTTNTKHPTIHVLVVCFNRSMTSLASIIKIYHITKVP
jgi:hypothetical protein